MSAPADRLPSRISRTHYVTVGVLCLAFGAISQLSGDEPSLTAVKLSLVPVGCLSIIGLNAIYGIPVLEVREARWTVRAVEHVVLYTALMASFVTVLRWTPGEPLSVTLTFFAIFLSVITVFHVIVLWLRIRRLRRGAASEA